MEPMNPKKLRELMELMKEYGLSEIQLEEDNKKIHLRKRGPVEPAGGDTVRQTITLVQSIDSDTARRISQFVRDQRLKKVQAQIQGDTVRISGANRDDLQTTMRGLREHDWGIELTFGNYR